MIRRALKSALAALSLTCACAAVPAANLSFTGALVGDNDVQLFSFTLAADADVALRTWSYAGGTNAAGAVIPAGGFDTVVSLFSGSGASALLIGANDDGFGVAADPATGSAHDALLEVFALPAGEYTVALTQFANLANGPTLGDGFLGAGEPGFNGRSSAWALDILGVDAARVIAEPAALVLAMFALGAAAAATARRRVGQT